MILDRVTVTREFTKEGNKPITFKFDYLTEDGLKTIEFTAHPNESDYADKAAILNEFRAIIDKHIEKL